MPKSVKLHDRYRLVSLQEGKVVIVFATYTNCSPFRSCQKACQEFGIVPPSGPYRVDRLCQDVKTGKFRWMRRYTILLKTPQ